MIADPYRGQIDLDAQVPGSREFPVQQPGLLDVRAEQDHLGAVLDVEKAQRLCIGLPVDEKQPNEIEHHVLLLKTETVTYVSLSERFRDCRNVGDRLCGCLPTTIFVDHVAKLSRESKEVE
jgi:hypothetical protein